MEFVKNVKRFITINQEEVVKLRKVEEFAKIEERINNIIQSIHWQKCKDCGELVPSLEFGRCLECQIEKDKEPIYTEIHLEKLKKEERFWTLMDRLTHPVAGFCVGWVVGLVAFWLQSLIWSNL